MAAPAPPRKNVWTEGQVERLLGGVLRAGVLAAACVVALGAAFYLAHHAGEPPRYHLFAGEPSDLTRVPATLRLAASWSGRGIIQVGLLLLIATPPARVLFAAAAFARERDWLYVGVSLVVLAILGVSITGSVG